MNLIDLVGKKLTHPKTDTEFRCFKYSGSGHVELTSVSDNYTFIGIAKGTIDRLLLEGWVVSDLKSNDYPQDIKSIKCECGCHKLYGPTWPADKHYDWCDIYKAG